VRFEPRRHKGHEDFFIFLICEIPFSILHSFFFILSSSFFILHSFFFISLLPSEFRILDSEFSSLARRSSKSEGGWLLRHSRCFETQW